MRRENYEAQYNYVLTKSSVTVSFYAYATQQKARMSSDDSSISSNSVSVPPILARFWAISRLSKV